MCLELGFHTCLFYNLAAITSQFFSIFRCRCFEGAWALMQTFSRYVSSSNKTERSERLDQIPREWGWGCGWEWLRISCERRREISETANLCLTCHSVEAEAIVEHMIDESFPPSDFCIASAKSLRRDKLSWVTAHSVLLVPRYFSLLCSRERVTGFSCFFVACWFMLTSLMKPANLGSLCRNNYSCLILSSFKESIISHMGI